MACGTDFLSMWVNGQFIDAVRCPFQTTLGPVFPVVAILAIGISFAILSEGRPALPVVMVMLIGGVIISLLPPTLVTAVVVLTLLSVVGAGYVLYKRASDSPV